MLALYFYRLCFHWRKSICTEPVWFSLCYSKADDSSLMQLCHEERSSAQLLQHGEIACAWPCVPCVCVCLQKYTKMPPGDPSVYSNTCSGCCLTTFSLSFVNKSVTLNPLAVVSPCVMQQQRFAVIAAFSYAAVFDLMKYVNRQAGYVTQHRVSGGVSDCTKNRTQSVTSLRPMRRLFKLMSHVEK